LIFTGTGMKKGDWVPGGVALAGADITGKLLHRARGRGLGQA